MKTTLDQRLAEWDAIDRKRLARRNQLQKQKRDARRACGLTVYGTPYRKLKWKLKSI